MFSIQKKSVIPFTLTALVIIVDQAIKAFIVARWPDNPDLIKDVFDNGFLWIYHVRNKAIAFSLGDGIPPPFRVALFIIIPIVVLGFLIWYYFAGAEFSRLQRWAIAGIIGGGISNIIDRIARKDGVVDFISVKFYGLFGLTRWPTFNVADASVVVCCIILLVTMLVSKQQPESNLQGRSNNE